jgi:RNA polymerase sigma-70 factor (ECF subfamily)
MLKVRMNKPASSPLTKATLSEAIQTHLGMQLRTFYGDPTTDRLPSSLRHLVDRMAQVIRANGASVDRTFINGVMAALPALKAFAISLTRNGDQADDLIQDTVLKAISKQEYFKEGTNLQAWLFTILRNNHFTIHRKTSREVADTDGIYSAKLETTPDQEDHLMMGKLQAALARLPQEQRNALLLVGLEGVEYEDAAVELGCAVGTIKSRVNRARARLAELLELDDGEWGRGRAKGR